MSAGRGRWLQAAAACLAIGAYAGLSHYCNSIPGNAAAGALLALAPPTAIAVLLAWRSAPPPLAAVVTAGLAALLYGFWPALRQNFPRVSLLDECAVYLALGIGFGRSLLPSHVAICTRLAHVEHGPLSPQEVRYTRRVTLAWSLFFSAVAALSLLLFAVAPLRIWSLYSNFCVLPLVGAMFVAESWVRRRALPQIKPTGVLATVRVYLDARPS